MQMSEFQRTGAYIIIPFVFMHWIKISAAGYHAALSPENEAVALPSEDAMRSRVYFVFETATGQIVGAPLALSSLPHF